MKQTEWKRLLRRWGLPALIIALAGFSLWQLLTRPPLETPTAPSQPTPAPSVPATSAPVGVPVTDGDFRWEARADGSAVLLSYEGDGGAVVLPDRFGALPLRRIGDGAFRDCGAVTAVTVPEGVTSLGDYAFYGCGALSRLTLPASLTDIGSWAIPQHVTVSCPADSEAARWCERRNIPLLAE